MVRESILTSTTRVARAGSLRARLQRAAAIAVLAALAACRPSEPLMVQAIQTGKSLNSDNSIAQHAASFRPQDTMYVAVLTGARGSGTLTVRWSYNSRVLHEVTKEVAYNDAAATDFRFEAADGFPPGEYIITVLLDGQPAGMRSVRVE